MSIKTYEQLKSENFVIIDNDFFSTKYQENYELESVLLLALIQKNLMVRGGYNFNLYGLYEDLGIASNNSTQRKRIKDCLVLLQQGNIIDCDVDLSSINNNQIIKCDIDIPVDNYTVIYDYELDSIISCREENVYNLCNLFVFLKYRIGVKKYCYWSQNDLAKALSIKSRKTIGKYIDVLTDLKLIKYGNVGNRLMKNGQVLQSNYTYVLNYEGADEILKSKCEEYREKLENDGIKVTKNESANEKRRIAALRNNRLAKYNDGSITEQETAELLQYEEEYYNLIKHNSEKLEDELVKFVLFEPDSKVETDIEVTESHFGLPNPNKVEKVDLETGEILEQEMTDEEAIESCIDNLFSNEVEEVKPIIIKKSEKYIGDIDMDNEDDMMAIFG